MITTQKYMILGMSIAVITLIHLILVEIYSSLHNSDNLQLEQMFDEGGMRYDSVTGILTFTGMPTITIPEGEKRSAAIIEDGQTEIFLEKVTDPEISELIINNLEKIDESYNDTIIEDDTDDQTITLVGNTLTLEDGGTVDLSPYLNIDADDEENQETVDTIYHVKYRPDELMMIEQGHTGGKIEKARIVLNGVPKDVIPNIRVWNASARLAIVNTWGFTNHLPLIESHYNHIKQLSHLEDTNCLEVELTELYFFSDFIITIGAVLPPVKNKAGIRFKHE